MKKLVLVAILFVITLFAGCDSGDVGLVPMNASDYNGEWFLSGTMVLNLEGREFYQDADAVLFFDDGFVRDNWGYIYKARFSNGNLYLTKDAMFEDHDEYCGPFEGGTQVTFVFPNVSPFFEQAYEGSLSGETAVFTKYCNYKTLVISGSAFLQKK